MATTTAMPLAGGAVPVACPENVKFVPLASLNDQVTFSVLLVNPPPVRQSIGRAVRKEPAEVTELGDVASMTEVSPSTAPLKPFMPSTTPDRVGALHATELVWK